MTSQSESGKKVDLGGNTSDFIRPKVFISYSWSSKEHQDRVISFATELMEIQKIDVVLDVFDLQEGQDKFKYMERCVNDRTINFVLIVCDKTYADKANERIGGVGTEASIITPELYEKWDQTRFVPIVFERDNDNKPYLPTFLSSRLYFDLSGYYGNYDSEYEKLIRHLWGEPLIKKPVISGGMPEWLMARKSNLSKLSRLVSEYASNQSNYRRKDELIIGEYIHKIKDNWRDDLVTDSEIFELVIHSKTLQDIFTDFLISKISSDQKSIGLDIADMLEKLHNTLIARSKDVTFDAGYNQIVAFLIHELLIRIAAVITYFGNYEALGQLVNHTYFVIRSPHDAPRESGIEAFFAHENIGRLLKEFKAQRPDKANRLSIEAELFTERAMPPYITKSQLVIGDMYLMQLAHVYTRPDQWWHWYPVTYCYDEGAYKNEWRRFASASFCRKVMPAFGCHSLAELRDILEKRSINTKGFAHSFSSPEGILKIVKSDQIGLLP